MTIYRFNGLIGNCDYGEDDGVCIKPINTVPSFSGTSRNVISTTAIPLAKWADDTICNKEVSISYAISNEPILNPEEFVEEIIAIQMGKPSAHFYGVYSDYTGHLWTEEGFVVGGHDVLKELSSNYGKYIHMEITVHDTKK